MSEIYGPYDEGNIYTGETEEEVPPAPAVEEIPPEDGTLTAEEQAAQNTAELLAAAENGEPLPTDTAEPPPPEGEPVADAPADDYNPWVSTSATAYTTSDATALEVARQHTATYMDAQSTGDVSPDVLKQAADLQKAPKDAEEGLTALEKTVQELAKDSVQTTKNGNKAAEEQAEAAQDQKRNAEQNGTAALKKIYTDAERQLLSTSALKRVTDCKTLIKEETNKKLKKDYMLRLTEAGRLLTQARKADAKRATTTLYRPTEAEQGEMGQREMGQNIRDALRKALGGGKFSRLNEAVHDGPQNKLSPKEKRDQARQALDEGHVDPDLSSEELAELDEGLREEAGIANEENSEEPNQLADNNRDAVEVQDQNTGATPSFNPSTPVSEQAVLAKLKQDFTEGKSPFTEAQIDQIAARMQASAETSVKPDSDFGMLVFGGTGGDTNEVNASFGERAQKLGAYVYVTEGSARRRKREAKAERRVTEVGTGRARLTTTSPDAVGAGETSETKVAVSDRSREENDLAWNNTNKKGKKDDLEADADNPAHRETVSSQHWKPKGNIWSVLFRGEVLKPNLSVAVKNLLPHISGRN